MTHELEAVVGISSKPPAMLISRKENRFQIPEQKNLTMEKQVSTGAFEFGSWSVDSQEKKGMGVRVWVHGL